MIKHINLLHCLSEKTYKDICNRLGVDSCSSKDSRTILLHKSVWKIELYRLNYKDFGHLYFMEIGFDHSEVISSYKVFEKELYEHYEQLFGNGIMYDFPKYDQLCCNYIEYSTIIDLTNNSADVVSILQSKCVPEQMDKALWDNFKKPHGTIEFCFSVRDEKLEVLARCHGTALKKRIADASAHNYVGVSASVATNPNTECEILKWLFKRYNIYGIIKA